MDADFAKDRLSIRTIYFIYIRLCSSDTCSRPFPPGSVEEPHYHTADEIIYVIGGSAIVGWRELGPGTAMAIDANTTYKFEAGDGGLQFLNFGANEPWYVPKPRDGTTVRPVKNIDLVKDFIVRRRTP